MLIFLSHNTKDKTIVEPIAVKLSEVFGADNIFYDSWSIQPGEGIIGKMNEGLANMKFFFFFVSRNSLQSKMVELEWQNALFKATQGQCRFIPIKIDDCVMPAILLQNKYIDFYNNGFDVGLTQIIDTINGVNTFKAQQTYFSNIYGLVVQESNSKIQIEIMAIRFQEPTPRFLILLQNDSNIISGKVISDSVFLGNHGNGIKTNDGKVHNWISFVLNRAITPGFPMRIEIKTKDNSDLLFEGILKETKENHFEGINYKIDRKC